MASADNPGSEPAAVEEHPGQKPAATGDFDIQEEPEATQDDGDSHDSREKPAAAATTCTNVPRSSRAPSAGSGGGGSSSRNKRVIRLRITDATSLVPKPCVSHSAPPEVEEHLAPDEWHDFATDCNHEIEEWREAASRTLRFGRALLILVPLCVVGSIPLFVRARYLIGALLDGAAVVSLFLACAVICHGASVERSARDDLMCVLDWHSEARPDVAYELVKERAEDEWLPIYFYVLKIVVDLDPEEEVAVPPEASSAQRAGSGGKSPSSSVGDSPEPAASPLLADLEEGNSLEEPLLSAAEREGG